MVFTDPPYNVAISGNVSGLGKVKHREFAMASGEMSAHEFTEFLEEALLRLAEFSTDGSIHFTFMDWRHVRELLEAAAKPYSELKNLCVWAKTNAGMGSLYRSQHELVFVFKKGTAPHVNNVELGRFGRNRTNVWNYPGANTFGSDRNAELAMHPTVKPLALVADAILDCSKRGGIILDAFAGSGTTLIAAEKTGRRGYGTVPRPLRSSPTWNHKTLFLCEPPIVQRFTMSRSAGCLRPPRVLWRTPIDPGKQISELCRTDRQHAVRRRRPQKTAAFKPLRKKTLPLSVVPQNLEQIATTATKDKKMPAVRIVLERLLNQQCQGLVALPHIRVAGRQPHPRAAWEQDHGRSSTATTRARAAASTPWSTITRRPCVSTISIRPGTPIGHDEDGEFSAPARRSGNDGGLLVEGSQLIITCANVAPLSASTRRPSRAKRRHVNSWLADSPFRRAVAETCRRPS